MGAAAAEQAFIATQITPTTIAMIIYIHCPSKKTSSSKGAKTRALCVNVRIQVTFGTEGKTDGACLI